MSRELSPVVIEGEGIIASDGRWYPEAQVRQAAEWINGVCTWFESLPAETQMFVRWEAEA